MPHSTTAAVPVPGRIARLPLDKHHRPVPWFVAFFDGMPDFRVIRPGGIGIALRGKLCWVCGLPFQRQEDRAFVIGPMCAVSAHEPAADELEQARRVWVRLTQGRGGHTQRRTGWRYYQDPRGSHASMPDYLAAYVSRIGPAAARLAGVSLECRPALDVIGDYGRHPGTLIFADPPYLGSLRALNKGRQNGDSYAHDMRGESEHRELLESLLNCQAAVVLCGYPSGLYDGLLGSWARHEIRTATGNAAAERERTEVLWSNRPFPQASLFDGEATA